ncbi:uncharacterized protein N7482_010174 [Penicillium canariense]|uniref:Uncharacterized protein n=1 Tax=Penicillium canariense TaxID=189055 RepID=A0A9W9LE56_9EURO|nr:uncharacterized protein N7482_010174 [Penicillium canariense]KAJ5150922.1 hypothetical protein N7482_010174 [Penicillium canariense]
MVLLLQLVPDGITDTARRRRSRRKLKLGAVDRLVPFLSDTIQSRDLFPTRTRIDIDLTKGRAEDTHSSVGRTSWPRVHTLRTGSRPTYPPPSFAYALRSILPSSSLPARKRFIHSHIPRSSSSLQGPIPADWIAFDPLSQLPAGCGATPPVPLSTRRLNARNHLPPSPALRRDSLSSPVDHPLRRPQSSLEHLRLSHGPSCACPATRNDTPFPCDGLSLVRVVQHPPALHPLAAKRISTHLRLSTTTYLCN